jgi:hypothetical protein
MSAGTALRTRPLLGKGTTNVSPRQRNNRGIPGSAASYAIRRQANSDATTEHVKLRQAT